MTTWSSITSRPIAGAATTLAGVSDAAVGQLLDRRSKKRRNAGNLAATLPTVCQLLLELPQLYTILLHDTVTLLGASGV